MDLTLNSLVLGCSLGVPLIFITTFKASHKKYNLMYIHVYSLPHDIMHTSTPVKNHSDLFTTFDPQKKLL